MSHGFRPEDLLVIQWRWLPRPPVPLGEALPVAAKWEDAAQFRTSAQDERLWPLYRFNFTQLSEQTPDLSLYRLVQHFNTPLISLSRREAGRHRYAYWQGDTPLDRMRDGYAYFWFFDDQNDGDLIVLEFDFEGRFVLRSQLKKIGDLKPYYDAICEKINAPLPH